MSWEKGTKGASKQSVLSIDQLIVMLAYWPVGAYTAPFLDLGLFAQVVQQELQDCGVYLCMSGPPNKGGALPDLGVFPRRHYRPQSKAGWCNASVPEFSHDKTSLGALLFMMMNGALKSELLVESWA